MRAEADVKVDQIRHAAKKLFLQRGFDRVSTASLAQEARVSKETLYSRYPSKEAVFADVLEWLISDGQAESWSTPAMATRSDVEHALLHFTTQLADRLMQRDYQELARVVIAETPRLPHLGGIFRRSVPLRALRSAESLLTDARRVGLIADDIDVAVAARMLVGPVVIHVLINCLLVAPSEAESCAPEALDAEAHVRFLLRMVSASN